MVTAASTLTANSPSTTSPASPSGPPAGGTTTPASTAPSGWWDSLVTDSEDKAWLANKNYPSANEAFKSARNLETMFGADKAGRTVLKPKDDADVDGWNAVNKALGVPEKADAYKLPVPEGADDGFSKTASEWFLKAGVTPRSANVVATEWNNWIQAQVEAGEKADREESDRQMTALKGEWGAEFDAKQDLAQRAYRQIAKELGLSETASLERAESVLGAANLVKFMAKIGSLLGEHHLAQGGADKGTGFTGTADGARKEYHDIQDKRMRGEIDNYTWQQESEPRLRELEKAMGLR